MFENLSTEAVVLMAEKVGNRIARRYPGIDPEDITAEALTELYRTKDQIRSPTQQNVYKILERWAIRYAATERYEYVVNTSQYIYTPHEVRALLKHAYFMEEMWDVPRAEDDSLCAEIEGDVVVVSLLDIEEALRRATPAAKETINRAFSAGEQVPRKTLDRAIDQITRHLNKHVNRSSFGHEGPGARRALTNANAQYITRNQW